MSLKTKLACLIATFSAALFAQTADNAKFEIADVHVSPKSATQQYMRTGPVRNGRYEITTASMLDLVRTAYGFDPDKILGGPSWLEMNHYDVIAKAPNDATLDSLKPQLQALLEDRFGLVVHKETKPLPTYALVAGKKPNMKEADGSGDTGCKAQTSSGPAPEGGIRLFSSGPDGKTQTINLGPGMVITFQCRNVTMESFASGLRNMMGANVGPNPVLDQTGLKGMWNFDVRWSMQLMGPAMAAGDRITVSEAIDKQMGLKLEEQKVPTPVIVVDKVNAVPTANSPEVAQVLPLIPFPTEFEVADVKPVDPAGPMMSNMRTQPGGRMIIQGMPMQFLLQRAFNTSSSDELIGIPKWAETDRFDINAKAPASAGNQVDFNSMAPLLRNLLEDRFKLKTHTEERPLPAYTLTAPKPKLRKADPESRTHCTRGQAPAGSPPGSTVMTCQNVTMEQFTAQLRNSGPGMSVQPLDATGLEGGWDFALTWSQMAGRPMMAVRAGGDGPPGGDAPAASDPSGGLTLPEAIEKQLGLKLELQKRPMPVVVIDHIEQKPTDN